MVPEITLALALCEQMPTYENVNLLGITKRMGLRQAADYTEICYGRLDGAERASVRECFSREVTASPEIYGALENAC